MYLQHLSKKPGRDAAIALSRPMRGEIPYTKVSRILGKQGLKLSRKEFYNLERKERGGRLIKAQELILSIDYLDADDFHYRFKENYVFDDDGEPKERVVTAIAFINAEMIRSARKYVSEYAYIVDAIFRTNRRLSLLVLVGIDSTDSIFPFSLAYIVSESAETYIFINNMLTELIFFDKVPGPTVYISDFTAGLRIAMIEFNAQKLLAAEKEARVAQTCQLQTCTWHAVEAIKAKLVRTGVYSKSRRDELTNLIWE